MYVLTNYNIFMENKVERICCLQFWNNPFPFPSTVNHRKDEYIEYTQMKPPVQIGERAAVSRCSSRQ